MRAVILSCLGVPLLIVGGVAATYATSPKSASSADLGRAGAAYDP